MARKRYIYTTDKGRKYLVSLDEGLGEIASLGFDVADKDSDLDHLPTGMKMRSFSCSLKLTGTVTDAPADGQTRTSKSRRFAVATNTASILVNKEEFRYKGFIYVPHRFYAEKSKK
jgi:hypothetical protein